MVKKKIKNNHYINLIFLCTILILSTTNVLLLYKYLNVDKEIKVTQEVFFKETNKEFNNENKYYASIKYKKFNELLKDDKVSTIAIVDNSSKTYNKFIEMINKLSYYKNTKIYLLEISSLSKKNEIKFYETDERLNELESNYIITVSNNHIISITTFENSDINLIIEGIGE